MEGELNTAITKEISCSFVIGTILKSPERRFIEAYRSEGLKVWGLSGANEPMIPLLFNFDQIPMSQRLNLTCMTADTHRDWLRRVRPRIHKDVKLITMDDFRIYLNYWMNRMRLDKKALKEIEGIGLHWYMDYLVPPTVLDNFHAKFPDKLILYTETCISLGISDTPVIIGSWDRAEFYIQNIIENMNHWTHAYMDWNMALNTMGGPTILNLLDAAILVNETSGEFYKQPIFYAMGHFSKFIQPGAERIGLQLNQKVEKRPKLTEKILLQAVSKRGNQRLKLPLPMPQLSSDVMALAADNPDGSRALILSNPTNVTVHVTVEDSQVGIIPATIDNNSICSLIYWPF